MAEVTKKEKAGLAKKMLKFQRKGLISYRKYIEKELANAEGKKSKKAYRKYLEKELASSTKKIEKIDDKLK